MLRRDPENRFPRDRMEPVLLHHIAHRTLEHMVLVAAYAFLSIHLDGLSVLDFLSFVVSFYITEQQIFEWEEPV